MGKKNVMEVWGQAKRSHFEVQLSEHSACKNPSLLYTAVISIVAVTAPFLIALLLPVNCFNLNL